MNPAAEPGLDLPARVGGQDVRTVDPDGRDMGEPAMPGNVPKEEIQLRPIGEDDVRLLHVHPLYGFREGCSKRNVRRLGERVRDERSLREEPAHFGGRRHRREERHALLAPGLAEETIQDDPVPLPERQLAQKRSLVPHDRLSSSPRCACRRKLLTRSVHVARGQERLGVSAERSAVDQRRTGEIIGVLDVAGA